MKITARFLKASLIHIWVLHAVHGSILNNSFPIIKEAKIVGGDEVSRGEIPYQIALYFYGTFICGGSFVMMNGRQLIITAAHCVILSQDTSSYAVVAGENDIAILTTDRPFYINKYVSPIRLPRKNERVGSWGVVSGWGRISENGPSSRVLMKAKILVGPDAQCDSGGPLRDYKRGFLAGIVSFNSNHVNCTKPMPMQFILESLLTWTGSALNGFD
ncbi:Serine protease SP24D [Orchesella cincta]|uniref:Serine protease SP24D n=1 Tax=Orchesella cincta TaxID=48709 RepID=A0A1D2M8M8_ORCCI|nr:Serine protease SP24D [Orchesella cincta]